MHKLYSPPTTSQETRGNSLRFTLVELALILTVLTAIASILLPVVYRGSLQAKTVLCSNNLTELGTWVHMYSYNNDDFLPAYEDGWVAQVAEQVEVQVSPAAAPSGEFQCPSQPFVGIGGLDAATTWRGSHYGINQHIASNYRTTAGAALPYWTQITTRDIKDPSSKILLGDTSGSNYYGLKDKDPTIAGISRFGQSNADALYPDPAQPFPFHRHLDGMTNLLMLDGHVQTKASWPLVTTGPGTYGYRTWHGEHVYPGSGREMTEDESE